MILMGAKGLDLFSLPAMLIGSREVMEWYEGCSAVPYMMTYRIETCYTYPVKRESAPELSLLSSLFNFHILCIFFPSLSIHFI